MAYFDQILDTYACQHCLSTGMLFLMNDPLRTVSPASRGQLVNMLTTLEPDGILGSNFVYLY